MTAPTPRLPGQVERHAAIVDLAPGMRREYFRLHEHVWPEVTAALTQYGITNYTIFVIDDTLIAYYEYVGTDHAADLAAIDQDPVTQRWLSLTGPCQRPFGRADAATDGWRDAREIWHLA